MTPKKLSSSANEPPALELFFGLVGPTGVNLDSVCDLLRSELVSTGYAAEVISLSKLIPKYLGVNDKFANNYERIDGLMSFGTHLKSATGQSDIVARLALAKIRELRQKSIESPLRGRAYIIRSFKVPAEVELFRDLYDQQFVLISVYGSKPSRIEFLKRNIGPTLQAGDADASELARRLIQRDYAEEGVINGQQVGKTFPLADYFVNSESRPDLELNLRRMVRLTFGHPYISPTVDEQAMFVAQAAGYRSLDLSRQVGAAVVSADGEIVATGCNEVPRAGGGHYWVSDTNPKRDFEVGFDANVLLKQQILEDVLERFRKSGWLADHLSESPVADLIRDSLKRRAPGDTGPELKDSTFFDVIEFGRAVHAEMAAITSAARNGIRMQDARLFCTTFPCHMRARHIVSTGISEVVFIEPYEKSRVQTLYSDSIEIEPTDKCTDRVAFRAFVGVAPRRYIQYFRSRSSKKNDDGSALNLDGIARYQTFKKKTFHLDLLEVFLISETKPPPPIPKEFSNGTQSSTESARRISPGVRKRQNRGK